MEDNLILLESYRNLIENLPVGVFRNTPGPTGHFVEANPTIIRMFEADSREEFLKHNVSDLYLNLSDRSAFSEKLVKQGLVQNEELHLKTLKGKTIWGSVTAIAIKTENGEIYFDGVIIDITEQKKIEAELAKSRNEYKDLFNTIDTGVFKSTPGPTGEFIEANPAVIRIFEADSLEDLFRHKPGELYKNPDERKLLSEKIVAQKFVKDMELHLRTFKGKDIIVLSSIFLKKDDSGKEYFYGVFTDITARHKDQLTLMEKIDELEKLNKFMVDRELKMIELKAEIAKLKKETVNK